MLSPLSFGVTPLTLQKYSETSQLSFISAIDMGYLHHPWLILFHTGNVKQNKQ